MNQHSEIAKKVITCAQFINVYINQELNWKLNTGNQPSLYAVLTDEQAKLLRDSCMTSEDEYISWVENGYEIVMCLAFVQQNEHRVYLEVDFRYDKLVEELKLLLDK